VGLVVGIPFASAKDRESAQPSRSAVAAVRADLGSRPHDPTLDWNPRSGSPAYLGTAGEADPLCLVGPPINTVAPAISPDEAVAGGRIETSTGSWDNTLCNPAPTSYSYQWKRDGAAIAAATAASYFPIDADVDHVLAVTVTACNAYDCALITASNSVKILESSLGLRRQYTYDAEQSMTDQESLSVNVADGNLVLEAHDLHLPGVAGFDLDYNRYYNSRYASLSSLGNPTIAPAWRGMPNIALFANGDARYAGESGYEATFVKSGTSYLSTPGMDAGLVKQADGTYVLTFHQSGEQQKFSSTGRLLSRTDRNGNTITFTYFGSSLTRITDTAGRATNFGYNASGQLTTITDPAGRAYKYAYDASGRLASYTDPIGRVTTYAYDAAGLLYQVKNHRGYITAIAYDGSGRVTSITSGFTGVGSCPTGATCPRTTFAYGVAGGTFCATATTDEDAPNAVIPIDYTRYCFDGRTRVTKVKSPLGNITTTDYTSANGGSNCVNASGDTLADRPCSETNARGWRTTYGYDATKPENTLWEQNPEQSATARSSWAYADSANPYLPTSFTDARGKKTTYDYDGKGNLLSETDPLLKSASSIYDAKGQVTSSTDRNNKTTTYTYGANGNLTSETDPLGNKTTYAYDTAGNKTSEVAPLGNVTGGTPANYTTTYTYDLDGRLLSEADELGKKTSYAYDSVGNQTSATDANLHVTSSAYDGNNRLTSETGPDPDGAGSLTAPVTSYEYDPNGNETSETDPRGKTTTYVYDADNRRTSETNPLGKTTTYDYDADGNLTGTMTPLGNFTAMTYDKVGRLASETDPLAHTTDYDYDLVGNQVQVTDANTTRHAVKSVYDAANRVSTVTTGLAATGACPATWTCPGTSYIYDGEGNPLTRTDAKQQTTTFVYDAAGQLSSQTDPLGNATTYIYDANGNQTKKTTSKGTITYGYDRANQLTSKSYSDPTPNVTYAYDAVGNRTSMSDGSGTLTYGYDALDRLTGVTRGTDTFSYAYDAADNVTSRTYPGGTLATYIYDAANQRSSVTSGGVSTSYAYNDEGNLTKTTFPVATGYTETRSYDPAGRLTEIKAATGTSVLADFSSTLDPVGNPATVTRTGNAPCTATYGYDNLDRLASASLQSGCPAGAESLSWQYDAVGNRTQQTTGAGTTTYQYDAGNELTSINNGATFAYDPAGNQLDNGARTFTYDLENRLTSTTQGSTTTTYSYDGDGNMLQASKGAAAADITNYLWDVNCDLPELAIERNGANALLRRYLYGNERVSMTSGGSAHYYLRDALGSTANLVSAAGATEWTYTYNPFGDSRVATPTGTPPANPMRFTGEYLDPTGASPDLYYLRAREHDTSTGRFLRVDPVSPQPGQPVLSPYLYADDRPTVLTDPSGMEPERNFALLLNGFNCVRNYGLKACATARALRDVVLDIQGYWEKHGRLKSPTNSTGDAYRHCLWCGLLTIEFGKKTALGIGRINEQNQPRRTIDERLSKKMDLHNNRVGARFGHALREYGRRKDGSPNSPAITLLSHACLSEAAPGGRLWIIHKHTLVYPNGASVAGDPPH
jgi:RHS repeat-associated protein